MSRYCPKCNVDIGTTEGHPNYNGLVRCENCGLIQKDVCANCKHGKLSKWKHDIILYQCCPYSSHGHYALTYCKFKEDLK